MIVLDTNALMMPVETDVRVFEELDRLVPGADRVVPRAVVDELEKLATNGGEEGTAASVGLDLLDRCTVRDTEADYADDAVLELATDPEATHAVTNDGPLRDRLLDRGVPVICLRSGDKLAVTQP